MLRYVADRFLLMPMPRWSDNPIDPISIRDVLYYLVAAADARCPPGAYDIYGPETYDLRRPAAGVRAGLRKMARRAARARRGHRAGVAGDSGWRCRCPAAWPPISWSPLTIR